MFARRDAPTTGSKTIAAHLTSTGCPFSALCVCGLCLPASFSEASFETFDRQLPGGLLPWRLGE